MVIVEDSDRCLTKSVFPCFYSNRTVPKYVAMKVDCASQPPLYLSVAKWIKFSQMDCGQNFCLPLPVLEQKSSEYASFSKRARTQMWQWASYTHADCIAIGNVEEITWKKISFHKDCEDQSCLTYLIIFTLVLSCEKEWHVYKPLFHCITFVPQYNLT